MSRVDSTNFASHKIIYQETISATPSEPTAVSTKDGLMNALLITVNPGITLDGSNRIDLVGKKKQLSGDSTVVMVSSDIGGGASISSGIVASFQSDAAAIAGVLVPYVGPWDLVSILPTFVGTHGTASEVCVTLVKMDLRNLT